MQQKGRRFSSHPRSGSLGTRAVANDGLCWTGDVNAPLLAVPLLGPQGWGSHSAAGHCHQRSPGSGQDRLGAAGPTATRLPGVLFQDHLATSPTATGDSPGIPDQDSPAAAEGSLARAPMPDAVRSFWGSLATTRVSPAPAGGFLAGCHQALLLQGVPQRG